MDKREELIAKLGELRREFEGFPEEQKVFDDAVQELTTNDARVTIPSPEEPVRVTDILLMARTLGAFCHHRPCSECVFNERLCCPSLSWLDEIDIEMLKDHEGEVVTFYREDE